MASAAADDAGPSFLAGSAQVLADTEEVAVRTPVVASSDDAFIGDLSLSDFFLIAVPTFVLCMCLCTYFCAPHDRWSQERSPAGKRLVQTFGKCPICNEALFPKPVGVCMEIGAARAGAKAKGGMRRCRHYFHHDCLLGLRSCPVCGERFGEVRELPELSVGGKNDEWFYLISMGGAELQEQDLRNALGAVTPFSARNIETAMKEWFSRGTMSLREFQSRIPPFVSHVRPPARSEVELS